MVNRLCNTIIDYGTSTFSHTQKKYFCEFHQILIFLCISILQTTSIFVFNFTLFLAILFEITGTKYTEFYSPFFFSLSRLTRTNTKRNICGKNK